MNWKKLTWITAFVAMLLSFFWFHHVAENQRFAAACAENRTRAHSLALAVHLYMSANNNVFPPDVQKLRNWAEQNLSDLHYSIWKFTNPQTHEDQEWMLNPSMTFGICAYAPSTCNYKPNVTWRLVALLPLNGSDNLTARWIDEADFVKQKESRDNVRVQNSTISTAPSDVKPAPTKP